MYGVCFKPTELTEPNLKFTTRRPSAVRPFLLVDGGVYPTGYFINIEGKNASLFLYFYKYLNIVIEQAKIRKIE